MTAPSTVPSPPPAEQLPIRRPTQGWAKKPALRLPVPFVVTVGNLKGGAGKTTSSFFLASYFALVYGLRVLLIDADPLSQSAYAWYRHVKKELEETGERWPFDLVTFPSKHVDDCIRDNSESGSYDVIIVDTGGESPEIFKAATRESHELVIACAPTDLEMERIEPSFDAAEEAARTLSRTIDVRVLLTKVPNSNEGPEARAKIDEAGFEMFTAQASNWKWYRKAGKSTNPLDDLSEYEDIGDELVAKYRAQEAA
ncbi:AAA family ATPase [Streptosporangium sp. NPDC020072]|uniref:ParA family protein n=1 Tax=Streptosporangium sp. NPDC020072 TaxID=3154788 RepID=UPI003429C93A